MKKKVRIFVCSECGAQYSRWQGKCSSCDTWNSINEESVTEKFTARASGLDYKKPVALGASSELASERIQTGISELDRVFGGGIVKGSLTLVGGEPGVGKSTLVLEIARSLPAAKLLYISGEESSAQIALRANRMKIQSKNIFLSAETSAEKIAEMITVEKPDLVFIDSIQTVSGEMSPGQAGTVSQLRECTQKFLESAKGTNCPIILIGHITKEGSIAGPKILEHLVDTVLYFEGDKLNYFRLLRAVKNRFGPVGDIAVFEMVAEGLREVNNDRIFLTGSRENRTGSVISAVMEGSRAIAVEIQALVSRTGYSQARRMAEGLDNRRLILMAAVIEKFLGLKLSECDIFSNLAGGLTVDEPALDLAICSSVISSYYNKRSLDAFIGEVGLSGEVRPVGQIELRIKILQAAGVEKVYVPADNLEEIRTENLPFVVKGIVHIKELDKYLDEESF